VCSSDLPFDPLAPLSDAALQQRAQSLTTAQLAPIIAQIRAAIEQRSQSGQQAIQGYTQALGNLWQSAGPQTAAAYQQATQAVGSANSELANRLGSFGQNLGGELQNKLALQDAPQNLVGQVAGGATQTAQGVANANFAKGTAELSRLASEGAHAGEYAAKQPGIVGLMGLQHSRDLETQLNKELADQLSTQSSKAQDTFAQLYSHYVDQEWQKTLARTSGQFKSQQAIADAKYKAQTVAFKRAELAWKRAKGAADRAEKQREANQRAATARQNSQRTAAQRAADRAERAREANQRNATQRRGQDKRGKKKDGGGPSGVPHPGK